MLILFVCKKGIQYLNVNFLDACRRPKIVVSCILITSAFRHLALTVVVGWQSFIILIILLLLESLDKQSRFVGAQFSYENTLFT